MGLAAATANLEWGECIVPAAPVPPALQAEVRKAVGAVPGWLARLAPSPWLVRALCEIIARPFAHAPLEVCNLVALVVSQENSCRYCYGIQRAVLKIFGQRDEHIDALVRGAQVGESTSAARAALDLARRLTRANPRPGGADFEALVRAGFSRPAAAEIVFAAAANAFTNRIGTLLVLPPEPIASFVASPVFRFVRPLLAWRMRPRPRAHAPREEWPHEAEDRARDERRDRLRGQDQQRPDAVREGVGRRREDDLRRRRAAEPGSHQRLEVGAAGPGVRARQPPGQVERRPRRRRRLANLRTAHERIDVLVALAEDLQHRALDAVAVATGVLLAHHERDQVTDLERGVGERARDDLAQRPHEPRARRQAREPAGHRADGLAHLRLEGGRHGGGRHDALAPLQVRGCCG